MSISALDWAYRQVLKAPAKPVLTCLANRANANYECWPSLERIALDTGFCKSTVKTAIKQLKEDGLLTSQQRLSNGRLCSNVYRLSIATTSQPEGQQTTVGQQTTYRGAPDTPPPASSCPTPGAAPAPKPKERTQREPKYEYQETYGYRQGVVEEV